MTADGEHVKLDQDLCTGCGRCVMSCPTDVFRMTDKNGRAVAEAAHPQDCSDCFLCEMDCPVKAIEIVFAPVTHGFTSIYTSMGIALEPFSAPRSRLLEDPPGPG